MPELRQILEALDRKIDALGGLQGSYSIEVSDTTKALSVVLDPDRYLSTTSAGVGIAIGYMPITTAEHTKLTDLPDNSSLDAALDVIDGKIEELEDNKLDITKVDFPVVTSISTSASGVGTGRQISAYTKNLATGTTNQVDHILPPVNATVDGLMTSAMLANLVEAMSDITTLENDKADKTTINKVVATDVTFGNGSGTGGQNKYITTQKVNIGSGATSISHSSVPLVDTTEAGLMAPEDYNTLYQLVEDVNALSGRNITLLYTAGSNPTAAQIEAFVIADGYTDESQWPNITVEVLASGNIWRFYSEPAPGQWVDRGVGGVSQFTNTALGTIKGAGAEDGKIFAETDGTGSVFGWASLKERVGNLEENPLVRNLNVVTDSEPTTTTPTENLINLVTTNLITGDSVGIITALLNSATASSAGLMSADQYSVLGVSTDYSAIISKLTSEGYYQ